MTALIPVFVSAVLGLIGIALALRKRSDDDDLARATRRTTALQLLTDEFSLMLVLDECIAIQRLVAGGDRLGDGFEHLDREAGRIVGEARRLLADVRQKRHEVEPRIETMSGRDRVGDRDRVSREEDGRSATAADAAQPDRYGAGVRSGRVRAGAVMAVVTRAVACIGT